MHFWPSLNPRLAPIDCPRFVHGTIRFNWRATEAGKASLIRSSNDIRLSYSEADLVNHGGESTPVRFRFTLKTPKFAGQSDGALVPPTLVATMGSLATGDDDIADHKKGGLECWTGLWKHKLVGDTYVFVIAVQWMGTPAKPSELPRNDRLVSFIAGG